MCGRFTLTVAHLEEVAEALGAGFEAAHVDAYLPRYNVAPGNSHWLVRSALGRRELVPASWGLVNGWAKDPSVGLRQINARGETLAAKPAWRSAFARRRCIIPADGFYEWSGPAKQRAPFWFHTPERSLLRMAGLWEDWTDPQSGEVRTTFTIVTTAAVEPVLSLHDRMPVLLAPETVGSWLDGPEPGRVLGPGEAGRLVASAASRRVNVPANDDAACLQPEQGDELPEPRQRSLF